MKAVDTYRWRYVERGRAKETKFHCTEDEIRVENPEAERIEGTLLVRHEPETVDDHIRAASGGNDRTKVG